MISRDSPHLEPKTNLRRQMIRPNKARKGANLLGKWKAETQLSGKGEAHPPSPEFPDKLLVLSPDDTWRAVWQQWSSGIQVLVRRIRRGTFSHAGDASKNPPGEPRVQDLQEPKRMPCKKSQGQREFVLSNHRRSSYNQRLAHMFSEKPRPLKKARGDNMHTNIASNCTRPEISIPRWFAACCASTAFPLWEYHGPRWHCWKGPHLSVFLPRWWGPNLPKHHSFDLSKSSSKQRLLLQPLHAISWNFARAPKGQQLPGDRNSTSTPWLFDMPIWPPSFLEPLEKWPLATVGTSSSRVTCLHPSPRAPAPTIRSSVTPSAPWRCAAPCCRRCCRWPHRRPGGSGSWATWAAPPAASARPAAPAAPVGHGQLGSRRSRPRFHRVPMSWWEVDFFQDVLTAPWSPQEPQARHEILID